jgi:hypothetical protein
MEKINRYNPNSMFIKDMLKIAKAKVPQIKVIGEICEERKPRQKTTSRNDMAKKTNRIDSKYILPENSKQQ